MFTPLPFSNIVFADITQTIAFVGVMFVAVMILLAILSWLCLRFMRISSGGRTSTSAPGPITQPKSAAARSARGVS